MKFILTENQKDKIKKFIINYLDMTYGELDGDWGEMVSIIHDGGNSDDRGETFFNFMDDDNFFIFYDCEYVEDKFYDESTPCPYIALSYPSFEEFQSQFPTNIFKESFKDWFESYTDIRPNEIGV